MFQPADDALHRDGFPNLITRRKRNLVDHGALGSDNAFKLRNPLLRRAHPVTHTP